VLELNYINNSEQVEPNDLIVTSGLDGVFPKGLALGRVVESRKGNSVFRLLRVEPMADLLHVEEVLILLTFTEPARD
jgi:rod shape-determining protein MreC